MFRISSGSTHGSDTTAFVDLLNQLQDSPVETRRLFSSAEIVVSRAPGRIDLMGGIADYSGSLVLPLPIAAATHVALQLHDEDTLRICSFSSGSETPVRTFEMSLADFVSAGSPLDYAAARAMFTREPDQHWAAYVAGAFLVLMVERGCAFDRGASILISSTVPEGKGVSSSAALEVAVMQAIVAAYQIDISPREVAFLSQKVENLVAGAPCGLMDQMTAARGEKDRLLLLLCQPGDLKGTIGLPKELVVWGLDSGIRHSVSGADYVSVRTAAFMGYRIIAHMTGLPCHETDTPGLVRVDDDRWNGYLANIIPTEFEEDFASRLPHEIRGEEFLEHYQGITDSVTAVNPDRSYPVLQATRHPIHEHERVGLFADVLRNWKDLNQAEGLGELMYQSHQSYSACGLGSTGTDELVSLVTEAGVGKGLYGAKITGGGSGGTVAVLGHRDAAPSIHEIAQRYSQHSGCLPVVISGSSPGAGVFGTLRLVKDEGLCTESPR